MNAPQIIQNPLDKTPADAGVSLGQAHGTNLVPLNPEALIAKAIEANVPVEALERLLAMRAELKREQARAAFFESLASFQASIPAIPKTKVAQVNTARGSYAYRDADIADIQQAIAPELHARGLSVTFDTRHTEGGYLIACIVHRSAGHSERTEFLVPLDQQARMNDAQKAGSALTYGRRYALCAALGIVTAEDDDDARATEGSGKGSRAGSPRAGPPVASPHPSPSGVTGNPSGSAPPARHNGAPNDGEPIQWITPGQHRRLEALIKDAGLPRERVRDWLAGRHPGAYPNGVRLNRIWVRHAEEIERNIPRFVEALEKEREALAQARQRQAAARDAALDWAADQFGWKGDLEELVRIAAEQAEKAASLYRIAQHKDGHLDPAEVAKAHRLAERARLLREFAADARERTERTPHPAAVIN